MQQPHLCKEAQQETTRRNPHRIIDRREGSNSRLPRSGLVQCLLSSRLDSRHSLATQMLRRGASLGEIGQLLRHQQPTTTQIYAKVDIKALRGIALPWMRGAS
jgi:site-specific recombinase XerD